MTTKAERKQAARAEYERVIGTEREAGGIASTPRPECSRTLRSGSGPQLKVSRSAPPLIGQTSTRPEPSRRRVVYTRTRRGKAWERQRERRGKLSPAGGDAFPSRSPSFSSGDWRSTFPRLSRLTGTGKSTVEGKTEVGKQAKAWERAGMGGAARVVVPSALVAPTAVCVELDLRDILHRLKLVASSARVRIGAQHSAQWAWCSRASSKQPGAPLRYGPPR